MRKGSPTGNKFIFREQDVRDKVMSGLDKISLPVIETIGPQGKNVLFENNAGVVTLTNDGVTIAREISVQDPVENAVIEIIKDASKRTNQEAGDATSTTILYARTLVQRAQELRRKGLSHKAITTLFNTVADKLVSRLAKLKRVVKDKDTSYEVAFISANNDAEVAKNVAETIETAGLDGMIFLDFSQDEHTIIDKQSGFRVPNGMIYQNLYADVSRPVAQYEKMPVIIFDKQLYYADDAEHILRVATELGYKTVCVVAKNFVGDAPNTFVANHAQGTIKVVLTKIEDDVQLEDLAVYLGGHVVSESAGRRVDSIGPLDFVVAESVYADPQKVLIKNMDESKELKARVSGIKDELKKDKENKTFKDRLASLTNGIVNLKIGGRTHSEAREKVYRYEDAINAVRAAQRDGFLVGGGLSIYNAFVESDYKGRDELETARLLARASLERLAENSAIDLDYSQISGEVGLNALTGKYENLLKAGVIEPYKATEMAIKNAVSVANILASIGTFVLTEYELKDE
jgi:chaperonin GroEL